MRIFFGCCVDLCVFFFLGYTALLLVMFFLVVGFVSFVVLSAKLIFNSRDTK